MRYPLRYKGLGRSKGIEPSTAEPQTAVLPLHHDRHVGYLHTNVQEGSNRPGCPTHLMSAVCVHAEAEAEGFEPPTAQVR